MKIQNLFLLCLVTLFASSSLAQPTLTVVDGGINGNSNQEWIVRVAPDASLFSTAAGGSLAVELGFNVAPGSLISATSNSALWPSVNPGNNPFTNAVTNGVVTDTGANSVFAALGSDLFASGAAVDILTIETAGSESTTLTWGGHTLLAGSDFEYVGSRIAQNGMNYDNFTGTLTLGGGSLDCDFDADGDCDLSDIDALYATSPSPADISNWLTQASGPANPYKATLADTYVIGDVNLDGDVNSTDLGALLNNFGSTAGLGWGAGNLDADPNVNSTDLGALLNNFNFTSASTAAVPEPSSLGLVLLAVFGFVGKRRRRG